MKLLKKEIKLYFVDGLDILFTFNSMCIKFENEVLINETKEKSYLKSKNKIFLNNQKIKVKKIPPKGLQIILIGPKNGYLLNENIDKTFDGYYDVVLLVDANSKINIEYFFEFKKVEENSSTEEKIPPIELDVLKEGIYELDKKEYNNTDNFFALDIGTESFKYTDYLYEKFEYIISISTNEKDFQLFHNNVKEKDMTNISYLYMPNIVKQNKDFEKISFQKKIYTPEEYNSIISNSYIHDSISENLLIQPSFIRLGKNVNIETFYYFEKIIKNCNLLYLDIKNINKDIIKDKLICYGYVEMYINKENSVFLNKIPMNQKKIGIWGSCASRNIYGAKDFLRNNSIAYLARNPISSINFEPVKYNPKDINKKTKQFNLRIIDYELNKKGLDFLKEQVLTCDIVIIDNIDERLGFVSYLNSVYARSTQTEAAQIPFFNTYPVTPEERFELWKNVIIKNKELFTNSKVYFHLAPYVEVDEKGDKIPEKLKNDSLKLFLKYVYNFLKNDSSFKVIEIQNGKYSPNNHIYGLAPFHYSKQYDFELRRKINTILANIKN